MGARHLCGLMLAVAACKDRPNEARPAPARGPVSADEAAELARDVARAASPCEPTWLATFVDGAAAFCASLPAGTTVGLVAVPASGRPVLRTLTSDARLGYQELIVARATPEGPAHGVALTPIAADDLAAFADQRERRDDAALLATIERLDARVGGDPYLADQRAEALLHDPTPAHLADAERWARAAVAGLPEREHVWWTLLVVQTKRGDHAGVVASLDELKRRFGVEIDRDKMAGMTTFRDFMASPEAAAWWARQDAAAPPDAAP